MRFHKHHEHASHQTADCVKHEFCVGVAPESPRLNEREIMFPAPVIKVKSTSVNLAKLDIAKCDDRILEPGKKVCVTEMALDDWIA